MPYNLEIPGQVSTWQLRGIEIVAKLVPAGGQIVEVGSLFGASSWAWAKSVDPSVTVNCIDPWENNQGVRPIEERFGIKYGLEQFQAYTADCDNVKPHKGYSPKDFADWSQPIDLYYEDAVHTDPILSQNLDFWAAKLKPTGILCGDDHRGRFPDVRNGARRKADEMNCELVVIEFFWCLLPKDRNDEAFLKVRAELLALAQEYKDEMTAKGPHASWSIDPQLTIGPDGKPTLGLILTQVGLFAWPSKPAATSVRATLRFEDPETRETQAVFQTYIGARQLMPDIAQKVPMVGVLTESVEKAEQLRGRRLRARFEVTADTADAPMDFGPRIVTLS